LVQTAQGLKGSAISEDASLECERVFIASAAEVLAVKQISRYLPNALSRRRRCDIVGVDLDVIHVSYKVKCSPHLRPLRPFGVAHIVQKLLALALYDVPLVAMTQDHDAVIGTVKVHRGLSVNVG